MWFVCLRFQCVSRNVDVWEDQGGFVLITEQAPAVCQACSMSFTHIILPPGPWAGHYSVLIPRWEHWCFLITSSSSRSHYLVGPECKPRLPRSQVCPSGVNAQCLPACGHLCVHILTYIPHFKITEITGSEAHTLHSYPSSASRVLCNSRQVTSPLRASVSCL